MAGYNPDFLGVRLSLPTFSPSISQRALKRGELDQKALADYRNYSVAMHADLRTPLFAALNIDQSQFHAVERTGNWRCDSRIGDAYQLNDDCYSGNRWDRGHVARRASAAWGESARTAKHPSDDTQIFSNACLQHANFNQDEWLALEEWVKDLDLDATDRISVFAGPIFGDHPRAITPEGRRTTLIPAAFFKIVAWVNVSGDLAVRAFIMAQDADALQDKRGFVPLTQRRDSSARRLCDFQRYQVSVTEIEERTGLIFPPEIPDVNPLFFNPNERAGTDLNVRNFPERIEVDCPGEVISTDQQRDAVMDDEVDVFIAAATINAAGHEAAGAWVSVINLTNDGISLDGWELRDAQDTCALSGALAPGEAVQTRPLKPVQPGNKSGTIALFNATGQRIDRVKYAAQPPAREDRPTIFALQEATTTA